MTDKPGQVAGGTPSAFQSGQGAVWRDGVNSLDVYPFPILDNRSAGSLARSSARFWRKSGSFYKRTKRSRDFFVPVKLRSGEWRFLVPTNRRCFGTGGDYGLHTLSNPTLRNPTLRNPTLHLFEYVSIFTSRRCLFHSERPGLRCQHVQCNRRGR